MGLIESVGQVCAEDTFPCEYRITVFGGRSVYIEGVKKIRAFASVEVVLDFKKSSIKISGEGLRLEKMCGGDVAVVGRIDSIERAPF